MDEDNSREEVLARHKKEKKELIAKTQQMKHSVPKGDKKKKKILTEIEQMICELSIKHEEELKELDSSCDASNSNDESSFYQSVTHSVDNKTSSEIPKITQAQKRRNKKARLEEERKKAIAEQEIHNLQGNRILESTKLENKLSLRNLSVHEIPSDGNCLYRAIEHQLSFHEIQIVSAKALRMLTAEYLLNHKEEFMPFLTNPETGNCLNDAEYDAYCEDIRKPSTWGGQIEVQALAKIYGIPIEVLQAEGPSFITGDGAGEKKLIISYHRHAFGLGEHYNSVIPSSKTSD